jgi:hypothetical protein
MGRAGFVSLAALLSLVSLLFTGNVQADELNATVALQKKQLSDATADPIQGIETFQWKNCDGGNLIVYEPVHGYLWAIFPENRTRYSRQAAEQLLKNMTISGRRGWTLLTEDALGCIPKIENGMESILQYRVPLIYAYSREHDLLTRIPISYFHYTLIKGCFAMQASDAELLAIRPFSEVDWLILRNQQLGDTELLKTVATFMLKERLSLSVDPPPPPAEPVYPPAPEVIKDEFETTIQFTARKERILQEFERKKLEIDTQYREKQKAYENELSKAEQQYVNSLQVMNQNMGYYKQAVVEQAWQLLFGDPVFENIAYNADEQFFTIALRSTRRNFRKEITVKVPSELAPRFKAQLLNKSLVPVVTFRLNGNELLFAGMDIKTNEKLLSEKYQAALANNTIEAYRLFIEEYPEASLSAAAKANITAIQNAAIKQKALNIETEKQNRLAQEKAAEANRTNREARQKAEHAKYYRRKQVGDKICIIFSYWWFGNAESKVSGFVEEVSGNRIKVRIADSGHISRKYNDTTLSQGAILWDDYRNWKHCE